MHCEEGETAQRMPDPVRVDHGELFLGSNLLPVLCLLMFFLSASCLVFWVGKGKENLIGKRLVETIQQ